MGEKGGAIATQLSRDTKKAIRRSQENKIRLSQEQNQQDLLGKKQGEPAVMPVSDVKFELIDVVFKFRLIKSVTVKLHQASLVMLHITQCA